jgi:two-component sensor histidine kinase
MGKAHDLLIENEWISADIRDVVAGAMNAYIGNGPRVAMTGEPILLTSRAALTLAMLLNELSANALKYGAWSMKTGQVAVSWVVEGNRFRFRWSEQHGTRSDVKCRYTERLRHYLVSRPRQFVRRVTCHKDNCAESCG